MLKLTMLLVFTFGFAYFAEVEKNYIIINEKRRRDILYICLVIVFLTLTLYSGMRRVYNDTTEYIMEFNTLGKNFSGIRLKNFFTTEHYGFYVWEKLFRFWNDNYQIYLFGTAVVINFIYLRFYFKYSKTFSLSMLIFVIYAPYIFSMAALKQSLAMAIALIGIEQLLKGRKLLFTLILLVAYTSHPYIILLFLCFLMTDEVWSKKMIFMTVFTVISCLFIEQFLGLFLTITSDIGRDYTVEQLTTHTINPIRVIADGFPVVLSWKWRKTINESGDKTLVLATNMMIVQGLLTFAALFANPVYIYRTGLYFSILEPIAIPYIVKHCMPHNIKWRKIWIIAFFVLYLAIFLYDYGNIFGGGPYIKHNPLENLFWINER